MHTNAAGIIPVVEALIGKGAALGTVLAFMMAVIALSAPAMIILRKVLKPTLIATSPASSRRASCWSVMCSTQGCKEILMKVDNNRKLFWVIVQANPD